MQKKASLQHLVGRGAAILKSWLVLENETPIEALIGDKKWRRELRHLRCKRLSTLELAFHGDTIYFF